jgi:hypothetical protein
MNTFLHEDTLCRKRKSVSNVHHIAYQLLAKYFSKPTHPTSLQALHLLYPMGLLIKEVMLLLISL